MKKCYIVQHCAILIAWLLILGATAFAEDINIPAEARPTLTTAKYIEIRILPVTKTIAVTLRKGYIENEEFVPVNTEIKRIYRNVEDNPDTPENETSTLYTQALAAADFDKNAFMIFVQNNP